MTLSMPLNEYKILNEYKRLKSQTFDLDSLFSRSNLTEKRFLQICRCTLSFHHTSSIFSLSLYTFRLKGWDIQIPAIMTMPAHLDQTTSLANTDH